MTCCYFNYVILKFFAMWCGNRETAKDKTEKKLKMETLTTNDYCKLKTFL